jgi:N-acetylglucosamine-6-phosphate deacetylase
MQQRIALRGGRVLTPAGELAPYTLLLEGALIHGLIPAGEPIPAGTRELDVTGCVVAPGFIDTHVHGGAGHNFMEGTPEALAAISRHMVCGGVTACLATTTSSGLNDLVRALGNAEAARRQPVDGQVQILGAHMEGPFVNPKFRGVHAETQVREATAAELEAILAAAGQGLKVVTLAPEIPGGMETTRMFASRGVQVSLGHSGASYQEARAALAAGVRRGTHLFNAMPPIHHRDPGPATALLEDAGAFVELIVDGHHIHPAVVRMALGQAGPDRALLVTDCSDVAGQGDGTFTRWEGTKVTVTNGEARTFSGSLAGSTLRMDQAVAKLVNLVGIPFPQALRMAAENPARSIGVLDRKGSLSPGKDADVVVLRENLSVAATVVRGQIAYATEE